MTAIRATNVTKSYAERQVLRGIDLAVPDGAIIALLGPNGAGKTSLVEILEGHRRRDGGELQVLGYDPGSRSDFRRLRRQIGVVLQQTMLEPGLRVQELLRRQASYYHQPLDLPALISLLGLDDHATSPVRALSGGLRRRLDIALALIGRPRVLFLDEPTTGLDPLSRRSIRQLVRDVRGEGTTVVLTSHDLEEVQELADTVHVLHGGVFVSEGSPDELISANGGLVRVQFALSNGDPALLPAGATLVGDTVHYEVGDQAALLAQLGVWAQQQDVPLGQLRITQPTLHDAYAALVTASPVPDAPPTTSSMITTTGAK